MSRMKTGALRAVKIGAALALGAAQTLGRIIAGGADAPTDRNGRAWTPSAYRRTLRYRGYGRSRYMPHQGQREIARRIRQLMDGQLRCWEPPVEPQPNLEALAEAAVPSPVKASVLIENGLEAERKAKRREAAQKAARTRAARKLEAANG